MTKLLRGIKAKEITEERKVFEAGERCCFEEQKDLKR